jgi:hypothetical protein
MTIIDVLCTADQVVGAASIIAAVVPKANRAVPILKLLRGILDFLALNVGNAKNEKEPR